MRRIVPAALAALLLVALLPGGPTHAGSQREEKTITLRGLGALLGPDGPRDLTVPMGDPVNRATAWLPEEPGTKEWLTLDYGPYTIHPGSDLSRLDVEVVGADGYAVGFEPLVVDVNGDPMPNHEIHIHHAHWLWLDPEAEGYHRWFYGTGEERTQGGFEPMAKADPRYKDGLRYGVQLDEGEDISFLSMLHNKTAEPKVVYLRMRMQYVHGTHEEIEESKGWDFHNLKPTLFGTTYNVPRTDGLHRFPLDESKKTMGPHTNYHNPVRDAEVVPGVGQVVTMPFSGTVIVGAGHSHPGAKEIVMSNLGSKKDPCPEDGDVYPGITAARSRNITRDGVFPSEEYQMGVTQPGWRMYVNKGDRLVFNGTYDSRDYAYPDAMSFFGFYTDRSDKPSASERCKVELLDEPGASRDRIAWTEPNQKWQEHHPTTTCSNCDKKTPKPEPGPETNVVHMAGFLYLPGNQGMEGSSGPPVVRKGQELHFVNEDFALGGVRHSVTSCKAPCNGPYAANYPMHDGGFHSGALGYTYEETYVNARPEPYWAMDTSKMNPGWYTYYCQLHPWMRGSFFIKK